MEIEAASPPGLEEAGSPFLLDAKDGMSDTKSVALLVLGMHRSGTSSVAGTLVHLGAQEPRTLLPPNPDNERGFFESIEFMQLNDRILWSAGTTWDDWRAVTSDWFNSPAALEFERQAREVIAAEFGTAPLAMIKDPRFCRIMPFWSRVFDSTGHDLRIIMPVRSPLEVAQSLAHRNGVPLSKGVMMWLRHVLDAEAASRHLPHAFLDWSEFLADWRNVLQRVGERLGVQLPRLLNETAGAEVDSYLSASLRHNVVSDEELAAHPEMNQWVMATYQATRSLAKDPDSSSARQTLDQVRNDFDRASKAFERMATELEQTLAGSRRETASANAERDHALSERDRYAHEKDACAKERDLKIAEAAELRAHVDQLIAERDALASADPALSPG